MPTHENSWSPSGHDEAMVDIWAEVEQRRRVIADELSQLEPEEWDTVSWCRGWSVRDVAAHLVHLAEVSQWTMLGDVVRNGFVFDRALDRRAHALAERPTAELIDRLQAAAKGRFHAPGTPREVALGELLVHPVDMFEPLGRDVVASPEIVLPVLPVYRRFARIGYHARGIKRVRLVASDTDWSAGSGPEVRGRALDVLLVMANRRQALSRLEGPGLAQLQAAFGSA